VTGKSLLDAYTVTFALGALRDRLIPKFSTFVNIEAFKAILAKAAMMESQNYHELSIPWKGVMRFIRDRRFFTTKDGYIGFGPELIQKGM